MRRKPADPNLDPGINGLGREAAPSAKVPDLPDPTAPASKGEYEAMMGRAVARNFTLASTSKELTDALKVSKEWYEVLYRQGDGEGYGSALGGQNGAVAHAR